MYSTECCVDTCKNKPAERKKERESICTGYLREREQHSQHYWNSNEEFSGGSELFSIIDLLPVSESACGPLVPRWVRGTLQVMKHDVHTLGQKQQ